MLHSCHSWQGCSRLDARIQEFDSRRTYASHIAYISCDNKFIWIHFSCILALWLFFKKKKRTWIHCTSRDKWTQGAIRTHNFFFFAQALFPLDYIANWIWAVLFFDNKDIFVGSFWTLAQPADPCGNHFGDMTWKITNPTLTVGGIWAKSRNSGGDFPTYFSTLKSNGTNRRLENKSPNTGTSLRWNGAVDCLLRQFCSTIFLLIRWPINRSNRFSDFLRLDRLRRYQD